MHPEFLKFATLFDVLAEQTGLGVHGFAVDLDDNAKMLEVHQSDYWVFFDGDHFIIANDEDDADDDGVFFDAADYVAAAIALCTLVFHDELSNTIEVLEL